MIIISVYGGIGNQMFQYALGKSLSYKLNKVVKYEYTYNLERTDFNPSDIDSIFNIFDLSGEIADIKEIKYLKGTRLSNFFKRQIEFFLKNFKNPKKIIYEKNNSFDSSIFEINDDTYLSGYWQSEKYFFEIRESIIEEFSFKKQLNNEILLFSKEILNTESVSVHFRGRDYLKKSNHNVCNKDYYQKCFDYINDNIHNPHYFIFSDDMEWAKNFIHIDGSHTYVDVNKWNESSIEDMRLMSLCKHNIIANSSFSWWAAWLNSFKEKRVLSPKKWFNNSEFTSDDIIPNTWIKI